MESINMKKYIFITMIFGLLIAQGAKNGTSAAPELNITPSAQYLSGGGAVAGGNGMNASYWNPAGLARNSKFNAAFSYRSYIADTQLNNFGVSMPISNLGIFGLSIRSLSFGDIPITTIANEDGTGETFSPSFFIAGLTYAKKMSDRINVGFNMNYISETIDLVSSTGISYDFGVQYDNFLEINNLNIGVSMKNLGSGMRYDGAGLNVQADDDSDRGNSWYAVATTESGMPTIVDMGFTYKPIDNLTVGYTYQENNYGPNLSCILFNYDVSIAQVRFGYVLSEEQKGEDGAADLENIFASYSIGASLDLSSILGKGITLDYGYIPVEYFDANQIFSVRFGL